MNYLYLIDQSINEVNVCAMLCVHTFKKIIIMMDWV